MNEDERERRRGKERERESMMDQTSLEKDI